MAIQGSLSTLHFPDLLSLLQQLRKTGVLRIVSDSDERSFLVQSGNLVFATTTDPGRRIGAYLLRLGMVREEDLRVDPGSASSTEVYYGEKLVELGRVTPDELRRAVRAQVLETTEEVMGWEGAAFHFDESELPFSVPQGPPIATQSILLEATRRADERRLVREVLPDLGKVLVRVQGAAAAGLSRTLAETLRQVDGVQPIERIVFAAADGAMAEGHRLKELIDRGLVAEAGPGADDGRCEGAPRIRFPVAPEVPGRLARAFAAESTQIQAVAAVVAQDPLLAAKSLRALCARKPDCGRPCVSIESILEQLGGYHVRGALLPEAIRGLFFPTMDPYWGEWLERDRTAARVAKGIAQVVGYPFPDEAYLAALLQNLGVYVLLSLHARPYRELIAESSSRRRSVLDLEEKTFSTTHPKLGAAHAESWGFPKSISHVIRHHHRPDCEPSSMLLNLVIAANGVVSTVQPGLENVTGWDKQFDSALQLLNFGKRKALALLSPAPGPAAPAPAPAPFPTPAPELRRIAPNRGSFDLRNHGR